MTDGVLVTNTTLIFNKSEKESGQAPSKLRMTADTIASFRENISGNKIPVATEKFNQKYQEIRQAVVAAETEAAEQQVRATVINNGKTQAEIEKERALELAKIREDQMLARLSSVDVVKTKISRLNFEPSTPDMIFGRNEKGLVALSTPKIMPRALMVPGYFSKIYKKIGKNSSLYKLADRIIEKKPTTAPVVSRPKVANWHGLFDNSLPQQELKQELPKKEEKEITVTMPTEQRGITKEELEDRKLKAQIGDELNQIRRLQKGIAGTAPFNIGLLERENTLLQMLSEITGAKIEIKEMENDNDKSKNATEFQRVIESIIGYKQPLTEEEHKIKEMEMEQHYTDPAVVETMRALQLKNILYDLNEPDSYERISEAERKDNELKAANSTALEILENTNPSIEVKISNIERPNSKVTTEDQGITISPVEEVKPIVEPIIIGPIEEEITSFEKEEPIQINTNVEEENLLYEESLNKELMQDAEEQARMLYEQAILAQGAEEQARMLYEQAILAQGAEEQARMLYEQAILTQGAEEQARMLYEQAILTQGAEEQARMLYEQAILIQGAEEQARMLYEQAILTEGAEEQARMLYEQAVLTQGAEEQARMIYEQAVLTEGAEEQARMLFEKERQMVLQASKTPKLESLNLELTDLNYRYGSILSPSKPIKVNQVQIGKIRSAKKTETPERNNSDVKDMLVSLKEQLEELGLGTEDSYQESFKDSYSLAA